MQIYHAVKGFRGISGNLLTWKRNGCKMIETNKGDVMKKINWKDVLVNCIPLWIYVAIVSPLDINVWLYWTGFLGVAVLWLFGRAAFETWRDERKGQNGNG
jgi:hypothetical protein